MIILNLSEIFGLIAIVLLLGTLSLLFLLLFKKTTSEKLEPHFLDLESSLSKEVSEIKTSMTNALFESMMKFNQGVNQQLSDSTIQSSQNITEFRINVNKELAEFQEKIAQKLTTDFSGLNQTINEKMLQINQKVEERLSQGFKDTNQTFIDIAERVKVIDEAQKKIEGLSNEMIGLQNILSNNQARGSFGEYQLNQILFSVFGDNPKLYQTQVTIKEPYGKQDSVRADAVIYMPEPKGMIAIDSKFPYSSYSKLFDNKDLQKEEEEKLIQSFGSEVKKHITDIGNKYIISGLTADYALMFVPSDGILALLHSRLTNIVEYARDKKVTIVSPTTLIPLLSSFMAVKIDYERSKHHKEISNQLMMISKEFKKFEEEWKRLINSIQTLSKQSETVNSRVDKITTKMVQINQNEFPENPSEID